MKLATWNVERLKHDKDLDKICRICNKIKADVLVLTETDHRISPDYKYCYQTPLLAKGIKIITADRQECIDHIAISKKYIGDSEIFIDEWNYDKSLSDHKGIIAEIRY